MAQPSRSFGKPNVRPKEPEEMLDEEAEVSVKAMPNAEEPKPAPKAEPKPEPKAKPPPDPRSIEAAPVEYSRLLVEAAKRLEADREAFAHAHTQSTAWNQLAGQATIDTAAKAKFIEPNRIHWANELGRLKIAVATDEQDVAFLNMILGALTAKA